MVGIANANNPTHTMSVNATDLGIRALFCCSRAVPSGFGDDGKFKILFWVGEEEDDDRSNECDGFGVGVMLGDKVVTVADDDSAVVVGGIGAHVKLSASSNTHESRLPSEISPMASLMIFHPGRRTP